MNQTNRSTAVEKRKLREQMLARRRGLSHATMMSANQSIARHFADHPILAFEPSFAGYYAIQSELDVMPVFDLMARFDKITALPCITEGGNLQFRRWSKGDPLVRNPKLNVQEPPATAPSIIPAVVLVPLLAFDGDGYRLGYGAGYYDRTMEAMRQFSTPPLFIGVAHSAQEIDQVPSEPHDARLDGILTELGVSMFS
jgi:5-formyltetrahydrofolate cyclo-ligase